ncbi:MAG: lysine--tRNA ligase [Alphaproteobacteria bacterium]
MNDSHSAEKELRNIRIEKLNALKSKGINPYPYNFKRTHTANQLQEKYQDLASETLTEDRVSVAGRIRSIRNSGMFIDLHDETGSIQAFSPLKELSPEINDLLSLLDLGDWIGVTGLIRRTKRGELTVNVESLEILSKSLLPLPEKYHGLTDIETRYRQRYIDLIVNEESRDRLRKRSQIISSIRTYLSNQGFLEVETPMLHIIPGGAAAKPFLTHHNALDLPMYLRIAPELHLKRLMVGGLSDKIFEMNRCFRNEGISPRHNPEFTSVELYQLFADYHDMMTLTESLIQYLAQTVLGTTTVLYNGIEIDLSSPWPRKSMVDLVKEETGVDFAQIHSTEDAREAAKKIGGVPLKGKDSWGKVVEAVFAEKVESSLIQPIHVTEHPLDISPLAKVHRGDARLTERFESYINTWEVANAFSELTDPIDQRKRFEDQVAEREGGDDEAHLMDADFVTALEHGLPPTGGLGIGIDRLVMILTNASSIRDVIAFPTMKPKD